MEVAVWVIVVAVLVGPIALGLFLLGHWVWSSENWTQPVQWRAPKPKDIACGRLANDPDTWR